MRSIASLALAFSLIAGLGGCRSTEKVRATDDVTSASPDPAPSPGPPTPEPTMPCEVGPIHFAAASEAERGSLLLAYHERNGGRGAALDPFGRYVAMGGFGLGAPSSPGRTSTDAEKESSARAFLRRNATFFGVAPEEVDALTARPFGRPGAAMSMLRFESSAPLPHYEAFELRRDLRFTLGVDDAGEVRSATNQSLLVPRFALCTEPALAASDPRVHAGAIGARTFFHTIAGKRVDVGPAEEKDLGPPKLTVFIQYPSTAREGLVALAYEMSFFGRGFTAFVDANTGQLLEIRQNFVT